MTNDETIISLRLNEELVKKLEKACVHRRESIDFIISELIEKYL